MGPRSTPRRVDLRIAALAERQHGVVTRRQLLALGLGPEAISSRIRTGRLHPVHRGVYLVGHRAVPELGREMAAVLACGPYAAVSHHSAARLWAMPVPDGPIAIEVLVPGESAPRRPGIRIRRAGALLPRDLARIRGVPVTSPARTIRDLGNVLGREHLERVFADAQRRKLVRGGQLVDQLRRSRGGRGTATLRSLVEADAEPLLTASEAEVRMLAALRTAELPAPECNAYVGGYKVDFVWRDTALIVEVDGYAFHADRHAFEADRLRDAELGDLGFRVIRVTWRQLVDRPQMVVARVRRAHRRRVLRREE